MLTPYKREQSILHTYIIGGTGDGKTVFAKNYIGKISKDNQIPPSNIIIYAAQNPDQYVCTTYHSNGLIESNNNNTLYTKEWIELYDKLQYPKTVWDDPCHFTLRSDVGNDSRILLLIDDFQTRINTNTNTKYMNLLSNCRHENITIIALVQSSSVGLHTRQQVKQWIIFPRAIPEVSKHLKLDIVIEGFCKSTNKYSPIIYNDDNKTISRITFNQNPIQNPLQPIQNPIQNPLQPIQTSKINSIAGRDQYNDNSINYNHNQTYIDKSKNEIKIQMKQRFEQKIYQREIEAAETLHEDIQWFQSVMCKKNWSQSELNRVNKCCRLIVMEIGKQNSMFSKQSWFKSIRKHVKYPNLISRVTNLNKDDTPSVARALCKMAGWQCETGHTVSISSTAIESLEAIHKGDFTKYAINTFFNL